MISTLILKNKCMCNSKIHLNFLCVGESVFMASMITDASLGMPRPGAGGDTSKQEDAHDPTKPNNHPLLKVCYYMYNLSYIVL